MEITHKKRKDPVYVVTRDGRRTEPSNHSDKKNAWMVANRIRRYLQQFNDPFAHRIYVKKTHQPWRIR